LVKPLPRYGDFSIFSKWRLFAILDFLCARLDHLQRAFGNIYHYTKFAGIDAIVSANEGFNIYRVWLENFYSRFQNGFFGGGI